MARPLDAARPRRLGGGGGIRGGRGAAGMVFLASWKTCSPWGKFSNLPEKRNEDVGSKLFVLAG